MSGDPGASGLNAAWYEANSASAAVTAQRCACGVWRHPARYRCASCHGEEWQFVELSPEAIVESWTITRRALHFGFADQVPYAILAVHTHDGPRLFAHLRGDPSDIAIGDRVRLAVDEFGVPYAASSSEPFGASNG